MFDCLIDECFIKVNVVYVFWFVVSEGDDIILFSDEFCDSEFVCFYFLC